MKDKKYISLVVFILLLFGVLPFIYNEDNDSTNMITGWTINLNGHPRDFIDKNFHHNSVYLWEPGEENEEDGEDENEGEDEDENEEDDEDENEGEDEDENEEDIGDIKISSLGITGEISGEGDAKAYLIHDFQRILINSYNLDDETIHLYQDCEQTCSLNNLTDDKYLLRFEIDGDVDYHVEYIDYSSSRNELGVSSNLSITDPITLNKKVKWRGIVSKKEIKIPKQAENITVEENAPPILSNPNPSYTIEEKNNTKTLNISQYHQPIIQYTTPPPAFFEKNVSNGKKITISAPENLNYTDIISFTKIPEEKKIKRRSQLKLYWKNEDKFVNFNTIDENNNSIIDKVQWTVPHLSNQTYNVIYITDALHLDENRSFIENIYNETKKKDGLWSEEIPSDHYVRFTFEKDLTSDKDITLYPNITSGNPRIEVYEKGESEVIAEFSSLNSNEYNKVYLDSLDGTHDTFDLKILDGSIELDHVVDPTGTIDIPALAYTKSSGGSVHLVDGEGDRVDTGVTSNIIGPVADMDLDGDLEVTSVNDNGDIQLIPAVSNASPTTLINGTTSSDPASNTISIGDYDDDGRPAVIYMNTNDNNYLYRKEVGESAQRIFDGQQTLGALGYGDFTNDGTDEVVFRGSSENIKWYNPDKDTYGDTGTSNYGTNNGVGLGPLSDYSGNGRKRVSAVSGSNVPSLINYSGDPFTQPDSNYQEATKAPVASADATGDGNYDILHQNSNTGTIYYMTVNGTSGEYTPGGSSISVNDAQGVSGTGLAITKGYTGSRINSAYYDPVQDTQAGWSCTGTDCATGHYAVLDEGIRQPNTPTLTDYIFQDSNDGGVDEHQINPISQTNVTKLTLWAYVETGSDHQMTISFQNDNSEIGTTTISPGTGKKWVSIPWNSPNSIGNVSAEFSSTKNGGGKPENGWVYSWYVDVSYIPPDTPPNVTQIKPADDYQNDLSDPVNVTFNCSATDDYGLSNISLYITNSTNQSFSLNQTTSLTGTSDSSEWIVSLSNGNYTWNCKAFDDNTQHSWGENRSIEINHQETVDTPPLTTLVSPSDGSTIDNQDISFRCDSDDDINLSNVTFYWNYSGTWQANGTKDLSGTSDSTVFKRTSLNNSVINWNCLTCDNSSQCDFAPSNYSVQVNYTPPETCYYLNIRPTNYTDNSGIGTNPTNAYDNNFSTFSSFDLGTSSKPGTLDYYAYNNTENFRINELSVVFDLEAYDVEDDQWGLQYTDNAGTNWYSLKTLGPTNQPRDNITYQISEQSSGEDGTWNFTEVQEDLRVRIQTEKSAGADAATLNIYETWVDVCTQDNPPNVSLNNPPDNHFNHTDNPANITFSCSAEDDHELSNLSLYITNSTNQSFKLNQTTEISGTNSTVNQTLSLTDGDYTWNCLAYDSYGNLDWGNNRTIKISFPEITKLTTTPALPIKNNGSEQNISIEFNSSEYPLNITFNLYNTTGDVISTQGTFEVNDKSDLPINYTIPTTLSDGVYYINMSAETTEGVKNELYVGNFTVENPHPPTIPELISPSDNNQTFNRTPTFRWNESTDPNDDNVTYQFLLERDECTFLEDCDVAMINLTTNSTNITTKKLDVDAVYNWSVRAYDGNLYSNYSDERNLTINSLTAISLPEDTVEFGNESIGDEDNTSDSDHFPIKIQNEGNTDIDLTISANESLWTRAYAGLNTSYFQYKAGNSSEKNSFNYSGSITNYTNVNEIESKVIDSLGWNKSSDLAELELKIRVPIDEPPGSKRTLIHITGK